MATTNLTLTAVRQLQFISRGPHAGWCVYWDTRLRGLGLRITASNARSYVVRYRVRGTRRQRLKTIGSCGTFTLEQARERAKAIIRSAELGEDWFDSVEHTRHRTMQELWDYYESRHLKASIVSRRLAAEAPWTWKTHCAPRFANRPITSVTAEQARDWHRQLTNRGPYAANRAAQLLRAVWNYGVKFGQVAGDLRNPFRAITLNRETARKVILRPDELPAFAKAVDSVENPFIRSYFWLLFYTGARRSEMLHLQWEDVDLKRKLVRFPETKNGESHEVQLSAPAFEILSGLPRTSNPYVFAGDREDRPLHPKKPWEQIRTQANLPHLRIHDLRRSFGSWLGAAGYSSKQVGTMLGHKSDITSRVYIQLGEAFDLKRNLATAFAELADHYREATVEDSSTSTTGDDNSALPARVNPREHLQSDLPQFAHIGSGLANVGR